MSSCLNNDEFINNKITEYSTKIAKTFYQKVSDKFKHNIIEKYGYYTTITPTFLDDLLSQSDFKSLCFSDIDFTMRRNEDFWVKSLEQSFIDLIDFDELKRYEELKNKSI